MVNAEELYLYSSDKNIDPNYVYSRVIRLHWVMKEIVTNIVKVKKDRTTSSKLITTKTGGCFTRILKSNVTTRFINFIRMQKEVL